MPGIMLLALCLAVQDPAADHPLNTWVKRTPLEKTPPSPRLGYEGDCVWDSKHKVVLRYGGHNQGGGGEQHSDLWTFDPFTGKWTLHEPNLSPPGVCCAQQNLFDPVQGRYLRFPAFSGSHGWQWQREIYLNQSSVWSYDLDANRWRNLRPFPTVPLAPLRCASWDADEEVAVVFGGEGSSAGTLTYDPYTNSWTQMKPPKQPAFRSGGNMTYDASRRIHILFGSQFGDEPATWSYDLKKNEWRDLKPEASPPTKENDAVLTYDAVAGVVVAIVKVSEGKDEQAKHELQTWTYDAGANTWKRMNPAAEPDRTGSRCRVLMAAPELNLVFLENCPGKPREQQIWSYRVAEGKPPAPKAFKRRTQPRPPDDVVVSVLAEDSVQVTWKPSPEPDVTGYIVEEADVEVATDDQLLKLKARTPPLEKPSVGMVTSVGPFRKVATAEKSASIRIKPGRGDGDPLYKKVPGKDDFDPKGTAYAWKVRYYRVKAVNEKGEESGPSAAALTIPSPVQYLFSKEEGGACHLKWQANPEQGIRGYRVYRMDGRYDKDPVTRLTADPIAATTFVDAGAGKKSRRYYVVAVDALGQEGSPSSPVWYEREWKSYYLPFIGPWHQ